MNNNLGNGIKNNQRPVDTLVERSFKALQKDYLLIGKNRIRSWHGFLVIGLIVGIMSGVILVANKDLRFEKSKAVFVGNKQSNSAISVQRNFVRFLKGRNGQIITVGTDRGKLPLPKAITEKYEEGEFDGYVVKLNQPSLIERRNQLIKAKWQNVAVQTDLKQQKQHIENEQKQFESIVKNLAPGAKIEKKFSKVFNGASIRDISEKEISALKSYNYKIYPNYEVKATLAESVPLINANDVWQINDAGNNKITGQNISIGIIDTGVDYKHSDLGGCFGLNCKVVGGYDFVNNDSNPMDDNGHGTHVAATAAGNGALKGVAPAAKIYAYKVMNAGGSGYTDWIIAGIEQSADPNNDNDFSDHLDVINLSLGGYGDPDDPMSQAIDNVSNLGVVAAVAAGNSGPLSQTIGSPGTARMAITVAASDKNDVLASFSSRGPVVWNGKSIVKPDITAPGVNICAAEWGNAWADSRCIDTKHVAISGTSMATPHIAGVAALVKQLYPDWSPRQIKYALRNSAININAGVLSQGAGRVDVLKTIQEINFPLIAELEPILGGVVRGYLSPEDFKKYTISYAVLDSNNFIVLKESTDYPFDGNLYQIDAVQFNSGKYILKLELENVSGSKSIDYGYFEVDKLRLVNPLNWDILRAGDQITLQAEVDSSITNYTVDWFYSAEDNSALRIPITGNVWDTKDIMSGNYDIKAVISVNDIAVEEEQIKVYLDSTLKQGWPQRVSWDKCSYDDKCYHWGGYLVPIVTDLNNDGYKEILVLKGGNPPKLLIYDRNGGLLKSINVGSSEIELSGGNMTIPIVSDVDDDGQKEIFVALPSPLNNQPGKIYVFQADGSLYSKWSVNPINTPIANTLHMLATDLNFDGKDEIVVKLSYLSANGNFLMIINATNGTLINKWQFPMSTALSDIESTPAVGNFDNDKDLEIVLANPSPNATYDNSGTIHVFNTDGSYVPGWPIQTKGFALSSPAVGDVNKDGNNEIVVNLMYFSLGWEPDFGGIYVFDKNGNILPGWPQLKSYTLWSSPSLGDVDGDGYLEIGASRLYDMMTYLFRHTGELVSGWPQQTSWYDYYSTIIGNVDGDAISDILTTAGDWWYSKGGVYGWETNGQLIAGFPKPTEVAAQAPATITDIDNDGQVEIITSSDWDFDGENGKVRGSVYIWGLPANFDIKTMHWPTFHHDEQRTGLSSNSSVNLHQNPGFENNKTNWDFPINASIDTNVFHSGAKSAKLVNTGIISSTPNFVVTAGKQYVISGWLKTNAITNTSSTVSYGVGGKVQWYDANGSLITSNALSGARGTKDWTKYTGTVVAPPGAVSARHQLITYGNGTTGTAWFDDINIKEM